MSPAIAYAAISAACPVAITGIVIGFDVERCWRYPNASAIARMARSPAGKRTEWGKL